MQIKSYENFHSKTLTGQNNAQQTLVTVLHTSGLTILKYAKFGQSGLLQQTHIYHNGWVRMPIN